MKTRDSNVNILLGTTKDQLKNVYDKAKDDALADKDPKSYFSPNQGLHEIIVDEVSNELFKQRLGHANRDPAFHDVSKGIGNIEETPALQHFIEHCKEKLMPIYEDLKENISNKSKPTTQKMLDSVKALFTPSRSAKIAIDTDTISTASNSTQRTDITSKTDENSFSSVSSISSREENHAATINSNTAQKIMHTLEVRLEVANAKIAPNSNFRVKPTMQKDDCMSM